MAKKNEIVTKVSVKVNGKRVHKADITSEVEPGDTGAAAAHLGQVQDTISEATATVRELLSI